ncbi:MAG: ATP-binding protein [Chthoniobacter sp.]|uniref:PAS domain-containing sensor histidine kinase n=1 Tax=Chthoniobacter sp. TaxID=2510640 RepID=UPI0032A9D036
MSAAVETYSAVPRGGKELGLGLRLAHAENALHALSSGQVDAIITPDGRAHLLRPAPEQARQAERRLKAIIDSAVDAILVVGRSGGVLFQSRATAQLLGYEAGSLVAKNLFQLVHPEDLPAFYSAFFNVIEDFRDAVTVQFRLRHRNALYRTLEASMGKLSEGPDAQVVVICRDVKLGESTREEAAQKLLTIAEAAQTKDRFLAMLSHELRTPLAPVLLGVQELHEDDRFTDARPTLTMIRRNLQLQVQLLGDLIDFTIVGQHKVRLHPESIDAHQAVRFVLEICRAEIAEARMKVILDLRAADSTVLASSARLQQVMWNLLKNAVKFSPRGGSISIVSANDAGGDLILEFIDGGVGIAPEFLPLVFNAFQQGEVAARPVYGSFGLGLFIAKGLAEAQGGKLAAFSEGRGKGATFRLTLIKASSNDFAQPSHE